MIYYKYDNKGEYAGIFDPRREGLPTVPVTAIQPPEEVESKVRVFNGVAWEYKDSTPNLPLNIKVENVSLSFSGFNRLGLGNIYTINPSTSVTIEADVALPNTIMTIMFVELGTNDEWLNAKYRFDATIQNGKLNLPVKLPVGNFILSCKRINQGLDYVNAGFHLEFEDIQFNCIVEV